MTTIICDDIDTPIVLHQLKHYRVVADQEWDFNEDAYVLSDYLYIEYYTPNYWALVGNAGYDYFLDLGDAIMEADRLENLVP